MSRFIKRHLRKARRKARWLRLLGLSRLELMSWLIVWSLIPGATLILSAYFSWRLSGSSARNLGRRSIA